MLTKISGLARALYIVLAIVTAFVALGAMDVALTLVVLGLIAGARAVNAGTATGAYRCVRSTPAPKSLIA